MTERFVEVVAVFKTESRRILRVELNAGLSISFFLSIRQRPLCLETPFLRRPSFFSFLLLFCLLLVPFVVFFFNLFFFLDVVIGPWLFAQILLLGVGSLARGEVRPSSHEGGETRGQADRSISELVVLKDRKDDARDCTRRRVQSVGQMSFLISRLHLQVQSTCLVFRAVGSTRDLFVNYR